MYLPIWFLIALTFWLRIWGSLHDGICDRGRVHSMKDTTVGWISWHVVNWTRRDFVIIVIYAIVSIKYILSAVATGKLWSTIGLVGLALTVLALIHKFLHVKLYWWALYHREKFLRGPV